jgi:hypothetical protein
MDPQILQKFYSCTIESILTGCFTAWYGNWSEGSAHGPVHHRGQASCHPGRGKPQKWSETLVTQVIDCFLCFRTVGHFYPQDMVPERQV